MVLKRSLFYYPSLTNHCIYTMEALLCAICNLRVSLGSSFEFHEFKAKSMSSSSTADFYFILKLPLYDSLYSLFRCVPKAKLTEDCVLA